jgi:hypothetical protein
LLRDYQQRDWTDKRVREICANVALTLSDPPEDAALRAAFKETGLDPINPLDWRRLLGIFAAIHFPFRAVRKRGARRKWNFELFDRHVEWARARTKKYLSRRGEPGPTHDDIALYLKVALPELYGRFNQQTLRTYIIKRQRKGVK